MPIYSIILASIALLLSPFAWSERVEDTLTESETSASQSRGFGGSEEVKIAWRLDSRVDIDFEERDRPSHLTGELRIPQAAGPHPAVVLMHGCGGLSDRSLRSLSIHANALTAAGFATLTLDSFRQRNRSMVCVPAEVNYLAVYYRVVDAFSALQFLKRRPQIDARRIYLMGQSHGGSVALLAAKNHFGLFGDTDRFRGVIAYYPRYGLIQAFTTLVSPVLVFTPEHDDWGNSSSCTAGRPKLKGEQWEVVLYRDAYHGFDVPREEMEVWENHVYAYDPRAASDSRRKYLDFLNRHQ